MAFKTGEGAMIIDQTRVNTNKCLNGHWYAEGKLENAPGTIKVALTINEIVVLSLFINGKAEKIDPFSSTAYWVGPFLSFMDNPRFFIKHANENQMVFGELEKPGNFNGPIRWIATFNRIA